MSESKADITIILDRSGSMASIRDDTIGGVNTFITDQKKQPGEACFTLVQFDDEYEVPIDGIPLSDVVPLTRETFVPRGSTALLDAMGKTINRIKSRTAITKPNRVIVAIVTDGHENASRDFSKSAVLELIKTQTEQHDWQVMYIGANQDAIAEARSIGIKSGAAINYLCSSADTGKKWERLSKHATTYRGTGQSMSWTADDRTTAVDESAIEKLDKSGPVVNP
jgi:hypothetical protein